MEISEEEKQLKFENTYYCPLWYEIMAEPVTTPCLHSFWYLCFWDRLLKNGFWWPIWRVSFEELYIPEIDKNLQTEVAKIHPEEFEQTWDQLKFLGCWKGDITSFKFFYGNHHRILTKEEEEEDSKNSHEWSMYVECSKARLIKQFISKVEFKLHPTFNPWRIIVDNPPYKIRRWGSSIFEVKVIIYWKSWLNREPTECSHMLNFSGNGKRSAFIINVNKDDFNYAIGSLNKISI